MFSHIHTRTVEFGDCDPAQIVFYPRFFAFFDAATAALFHAALGRNLRMVFADHGIVGIPLVSAEAKFISPAAFGDVIQTWSTVTEFGRSSIKLTHRISHGGRLCVEGHEVRVWAGRAPGDPARLMGLPIPDDVRTAFAREGSPPPA